MLENVAVAASEAYELVKLEELRLRFSHDNDMSR
jgi:hypothetical protein